VVRQGSIKLHYDEDTNDIVISTLTTTSRAEYDGRGCLYARIEDIDRARAVDLQRALREVDGDLVVVRNQQPDFDWRYAGSDVFFHVDVEQMQLVVYGGIISVNSRMAIQSLEGIVAAYLSTQKAKAISVDVLDEFAPSGPYPVSITVQPVLRGRSVGDLLLIGEGLGDLLSAVESDVLDRDAVVALVRAGRGDLLVGQQEGNWFDAKSLDYDLTSDAGKFSVAQDVMRFANCDTGGVIVIGLSAKKNASSETVIGICPQERPSSWPRQHRQAIEKRIFPLPHGLEFIDGTGLAGMVLAIHIPPQPDEEKPFIVRGVLAGLSGDGAFVSIIRRHGDDSIPYTAEEIHAALSKGRAVRRKFGGAAR
jgi:hypothetical protein